MLKKLKIAFALVAAFGFSFVEAGAEPFYQKDYSDLRLLILTKSQFDQMRADGTVLIDLSMFARPEASSEEVHSKYMIQQPAGKTVREQLELVEQKLGKILQTQFRIIIASKFQMRMTEIAQVLAGKDELKTVPGDVIVIRPGVPL